MQNKIDKITDILRRDDGISGAMHYSEQISWILFLKFLDDYEINLKDLAFLDGKDYKSILEEKFSWSVWAAPKKDGKLDVKNALSGKDLLDFVNNELFPYLKNFKSNDDFKSIEYKIGGIFEFIDNRIANGHTLREVINIVDEMSFNKEDDVFALGEVYEKLLKDMGSDGGNSGEFYTPRPLIKAMVEVINPKVKERIYDPSCGSCGFLVESFLHILYEDRVKGKKANLSVEELEFLKNDALFGQEKTPLSYAMGVMNMILHEISSPNIIKTNTLSKKITDITESQRYEVILANPPFGGKEKEQIQENFPIKSNATELLFLQHILKSLKNNGRCAIVVPEGVLFQNSNAFVSVKKDLLDDFNLECVLSLPSGVFLPYSAVKTNVLFFSKGQRSICGENDENVYYYELIPPFKLTKNKPLEYAHFDEFLKCYKERKITPNSYLVSKKELKERNYDLSAKNPNTKEEKILREVEEILDDLNQNQKKAKELLEKIQKTLI
ncbi:type I restriction-modification system subunit M [Campylobacter lari]|uniref:type I restriction-modification system subunit M n=1 Tax=Campylobacter lari TaxID=201 RepID=UPI0017A510C3|nr:SAM-dependent DNA methyltransferase [Campylobacter lari]ECP5284035.1 SAM-dependent DNA methyltransferase [Campylobacter lari]MCV3526387.1 type I restriction-modification system subunit M [Campylobacter lari]MCV3533726.1 type I restriction-modification system subunit M [Campylobacter lari]MCV3534640.1 type I restriction-modification system subunit M [Campylobacter lari]